MTDPFGWSEPVQVGNTFPAQTLASCNVVTCNLMGTNCCAPVFSGDSPNAGNCIAHQCVGQRLGGGGDYMGLTVVSAGAYGDSNERFAPAWTDSGNAAGGGTGTAVRMSFVDVLQ